jgi:hypothetical protein
MAFGECARVLEMDIRIVERRPGVADALQYPENRAICEQRDCDCKGSEREE